jgi:hypothetical protein
MAAARKKHTPKKKVMSRPQAYAAFVGDLLDGTVEASKLIEGTDAQGRPDFEFDDPTG